MNWFKEQLLPGESFVAEVVREDSIRKTGGGKEKLDEDKTSGTDEQMKLFQLWGRRMVVKGDERWT